MNTLRQDSLAGIVVFLVAPAAVPRYRPCQRLTALVGLLTGIIGGPGRHRPQPLPLRRQRPRRRTGHHRRRRHRIPRVPSPSS